GLAQVRPPGQRLPPGAHDRPRRTDLRELLHPSLDLRSPGPDRARPPRRPASYLGLLHGRITPLSHAIGVVVRTDRLLPLDRGELRHLPGRVELPRPGRRL